MKAPITQAQAWAVIAESAGWNAKELPVLPVIWAISYDGVTPYTLWHEGDGPLLDCEVKRQGGTTQKMPLFTRPMPAQDVTELVEVLQWLRDAMTEGDQSDFNHAIAKCFEALAKHKGAR